jgi:hypothetical protein
MPLKYIIQIGSLKNEFACFCHIFCDLRSDFWNNTSMNFMFQIFERQTIFFWVTKFFSESFWEGSGFQVRFGAGVQRAPLGEREAGYWICVPIYN